MKIAVFSAKRYDRDFLDAANVAEGHELHYFEVALGSESAGPATGRDAVCIFVNDVADASVLEAIATISETTLRSASEFAAKAPLSNEIRTP
jgi:D-lactate dehydrogenase